MSILMLSEGSGLRSPVAGRPATDLDSDVSRVLLFAAPHTGT